MEQIKLLHFSKPRGTPCNRLIGAHGTCMQNQRCYDGGDVKVQIRQRGSRVSNFAGIGVIYNPDH